MDSKLAHWMVNAMSEPSPSAAPIGAASSSLSVLQKSATCATQGQKIHTTIAKKIIFPRNSTSVGFLQKRFASRRQEVP